MLSVSGPNLDLQASNKSAPYSQCGRHFDGWLLCSRSNR